MKITVIPAAELTPELICRWNALQTADQNFDSPFFRAEYTRAVALVRSDVEVALIESDGRYVGFWPFQRGRRNVARPVGCGLTDFQGVVLEAGTLIDPWQLLRDCRLSAWHFDHLIAAQGSFAPFHWTQVGSPFVDISAGYEAYVEGRRLAKSRIVLQSLQKRAKAQRQFGPARFELHSTDRRMLEALVAWKSRQYEQTRVLCPFSFDWTRNLLERLLDLPADGHFAAVMSGLYFGDRLAAVHLGLRTGAVVHWWFPTFDRDLYKYSPGTQLQLDAIQAFAAVGVARFDLGKGPESYKQRFMTGSTPLAEGSVDSRAMARAVRRTLHQAHHWVRDSRLRGPMMAPWRLIRNVRDQMYFR